MDHNQLIIEWGPDPVFIRILGLSIRYYSLLFATGFLLSYFLIKKVFDEEGYTQSDLDRLTIYSFIGAILGARLGHCLFYEFNYYIKNPLEIVLPCIITDNGKFIITGYQGLASHGGAIGLLIAGLLFSRKTKIRYITVLSFYALAAPLAGAFIRLGNFFNSEIIGYPSNLPFAIVFSNVDNLPRHPAQLYESCAYILSFIIVYRVYRRRRDIINNAKLTGLSLTLIFISRFFLEFIKEKQVDFESSLLLNMGQLLSIPFIVTGLGFLIYQAINHNNKKNV
jgi:phosphatidylglycerol---prolipoprotein diacylglyceryl transferase